MNKVWPWIFGIIVGLDPRCLVVSRASERQAYRIARGAVEQRVELTGPHR